MGGGGQEEEGRVEGRDGFVSFPRSLPFAPLSTHLKVAKDDAVAHVGADLGTAEGVGMEPAQDAEKQEGKWGD